MLKTWKTPKQACLTETKPCSNIRAVKLEHPPPTPLGMNEQQEQSVKTIH